MTPPPELTSGNPALAMCRSVLEAMAEGVVVVREDGALLAANAAALKLLELAPEDLPLPDFFTRWPMARGDGTPFASGDHPFRAAFRDGAPRQSQLLGLTRPDGSRRWLSCGMYPVPATQPGEPRLLIAAFEVLALQRQTDIELRAMTEFSPVGVYLQDTRGNCLHVNRRWEELTGMPYAEARQHGWMRLIHPDDTARTAAVWESSARDGRSFHSEMRMVRPDGRVIWVSVRADRVDLADGALTGYAGTLIDITARKEAEAALAASEQRLRACIESTPYVAVQWFDEQGRVTFWNSASEIIFGWSAAEALGHTLDKLIYSPEEAREFTHLLQSVKATGQPHGPIEYEFQKKDGSRGVCLPTVFSIPPENGEARFVCMDVDITARRHADRLVVGQQSILELIAMGTPINTVLEQVARFIELNAPGLFASVLLLDNDGVTLRHGAAPSLAESYQRAIDGVRAGEGVGSCGTAVARREPVIVEDIQTNALWAAFRPLAAEHGLRACWSTPAFAPDGSVVGTFACYHRTPHKPTREETRLVEMAVSLLAAVVERDRAQAALRASEQRLRLLVDNSHDIVIEVDMDGTIRHASAGLETIVGSLGENFSGAQLLERVHPDDRVLATSALNQQQGSVTFRFQRSPEEWLWFEGWGRQYTVPGGESRAVIFARNVTERQAAAVEQARLEQQLRQSQRLEAVGTLAGGVAHDFNNILAGILGHVELLALDLPADSPMQDSVRQIMRGTVRARDLVRQILTFSRSKEIRREPIRLSAAVEEALKLLRASLPSSIEFVTQWLANEPLIQADPGQIHQIVMKVGLNASHAIGARPGQLRVSVAMVNLEEAFTDGHPPLLPGRHVKLVMQDNGCGMSAELAQRIFDPFFTTKPQGQGTGLGLATVHGIVQMHQGAVTVESQPGAGATFTFYFRAMEAAGGMASAAEHRVALGQGQRILVVDDEDQVMWTTRNFLERLHYRPTGFQRAAEAWEVFQQSPDSFDAVLTDLTMPQLGGLELPRRVHALRPAVPIILMSGYLLAVDDEELTAAGVKQTIIKPFSVQGLSEAIARAFGPRHPDSGL